MATVALMFGGSMALATSAAAAPGDAVVFADADLETAVATALGVTAPVTEAQAATLTSLNASSSNISDIGGIEYLTGLTDLGLDNNSITNITALSSLTNLTRLDLYNNSITGITGLSGLTNLSYLDVGINRIADISGLSSLTNLTQLYVDDQVVAMPPAAAGTPTTNPVVGIAGGPVTVTSSDAGFAYLPTPNTWTFTTTGSKAMIWNTSVTIGGTSDVEFSGTINQDITDAPVVVEDVYPEDPEVIQASCVNGEVVGPQITLPTTDGIQYVIDGDVTAGATVTVNATLTASFFMRVAPGSDWVGDSDFTRAALEITLGTVDCATPPASSNGEVLPATGMDQSMTLLGGLGALMTLTGAALVIGRLRIATR